MAAHTVMMDFSMDPARLNSESEMKIIEKDIVGVLSKHYSDLHYHFETVVGDGRLALYADKKTTCVQIRFFHHGLLLVNIEYFKGDHEPEKMTYELRQEIQQELVKKLSLSRGNSIPPIKRNQIAKYFPLSDDRILEYDIDKVLFDKRSPFQKIQIVHSKTLGNMLVLDELQNIAESDLIYTETLMGRGIEDYSGKEVCILGGGDGALLYELLKENPKFVVMLEIDEMVMEACNKYMPSICGDVLEKRKDENYEIIVGDCTVYMDQFIKEGRKFDYVFGDLTDIPISDAPTGELWNFVRSIWEKSFQILKPDGKFITHGNGVSCEESLQMFESELNKLKPPVKFSKSKAFVPSFMEDWIFYKVQLADC